MFLAAALAVGGLLAVQASVNLQLGAAVGTPYGAATVQLAVSAGLLALVVSAAGSWAALGGIDDVAWWQLLGGIASPIYITSAIVLFPRMGALASVGLFVTGQMFASIALDVGGLLGVEQRPLGPGMLLGGAAVLAGIAVVIRSQLTGAQAHATVAARIGWVALGLVAGAVLPVQGATNAELRRALGDPFATGLWSFLVATATIAIALLVLVTARRTPPPRFGALTTVPWWGWLGGAAAATYVTVTFSVIPQIGAATTIALTVTGQQIASAAIDHKGWFQLPAKPVTAERLGGLAALSIGCALVQLA
ncbi:DMT family transporter [Nocardia yamanashiensis]|uniref:DMT family transporter n=1 Tax=Nocardia yamanashiensis TaxID=209247 RepID=UPI001E4F1E55|nr:DMT family transporter [Nocardia yamanashiensis]UGT46019.1 DMT family transporter [Nocardia yamanashiensis]